MTPVSDSITPPCSPPSDLVITETEEGELVDNTENMSEIR